MRRVSPAQTSAKNDRRGSATVEFGIIAPLFVALFMGMLQAGTNFSVAQQLYSSLRQAGRLASQDFSEKLQVGQTANDKVISDVKNQLKAYGIDTTNVQVTITHADGASAGTTFDLQDTNNDLKYFKLEITVPYSAVNKNGFLPNTLSNLKASIVFRKGKTVTV
jgi:Flp pilus assembly protein TadG